MIKSIYKYIIKSGEYALNSKKELLNTLLVSVSHAFYEFRAKFRNGKTVNELFEPFIKTLENELGEFDILYDYIWGKDTLNIDGVTDDSYIPQAGDSAIMDISVGKNGVWCDVCRTFFVGSVSDEQAHIFELIKKSIKSGEKHLIPDMSADDIYKAVNSVYENDGKSLIHHAGHQIGKSALEEPRFILNNNTKIEADSFYTIESGYYGDFGIRLENDYFVDNNNTQNLFEKLMSLDIKEYILYEKEC